MKTLIMRVYSGGSLDPILSYHAIELDLGLCRHVLELAEEATELLGSERPWASVEAYHAGGTWYDSLDCDALEEQYGTRDPAGRCIETVLDQGGHDVLPGPIPENTGSESHVEVVRMIFYPAEKGKVGVAWSCSPHDTDIYQETWLIPLDVFRAVVTEKVAA